MNEKTATLVSNATAALVGLLGAFATVFFPAGLDQGMLVAGTSFVTALTSLSMHVLWKRYSSWQEETARKGAERAAQLRIQTLEQRVDEWSEELRRENTSDAERSLCRDRLDAAFAELRWLDKVLAQIQRAELDSLLPLPKRDGVPPSSSTVTRQLASAGSSADSSRRDESRRSDQRRAS